MSDFAEINKVLRQKLSKQAQLPVLAKNIPLLLEALSDDDLSYRQLAEVIKQYPDIAARLLFLANSSWSAPVSPVKTIEQACSRLGLSVVKSVSIAVSISKAFDAGKCLSFNTVRYWTTALMVADGAGKIARLSPVSAVEEDFVQTAQTAGLLHNLGLLWLADNLPNETCRALDEVKQQPELCVSESLKQTIGVDYCLIGSWLAKKLQFSDVLRVAIVEHLNDEYQGIHWEIVTAVSCAVKMVGALQHQQAFIELTQLESLGIDATGHEKIFQQLSSQLESTQQLAKTLFSG
jgi:HD-like signal output (HDOD) protein